MENFESVYEIPYELLMLHFLKVAYPTKNLRQSVMEQFERVLDVTGSKFLSEEEILNNELQERNRLARIESSIPKGMYLSDYPEDHLVWAELGAMHERSNDNNYMAHAPMFQESFFASLGEIQEEIGNFEKGKPIVASIYKENNKQVSVVAIKGKVFEIDGDETTEFYSADTDSVIIDEIFANIQSKINEQNNQSEDEM